MPKYWGKQIFAHGRFPEVGEKQKTERKERENRLSDRTLAVPKKRAKINFFSLKNKTLAQAALRAPHEVALQCVAGHCYYQLSLFFFFFSPSFAFDPLRGISRVRKFVSPNILA